MSILYNSDMKVIPWEQYSIWRRTSYWLPSVDEDLKDETEVRTRSILPHIGMMEATLLSEKVVMYTIQDCVLSKIQTEILATLLPRELITQDTLQGKTRTRFVGALMFGDVSGFTALCEKYFAEGGKGGTYKLTATLNCYIGAMVDVIYSYGGDIIKFSGDAFLAVWKVGQTDFIFEIVHKVIECAMYIQHSLGSYETDANVLLRVKLAISAGNVIFSSIGSEQAKYYVIYGYPVDEVKEAQDTCVSGDVILAPSAWGHCSQVNYLYTNKDEKHIKILRIIYHPLQVTRKVYQLPPKHIVDLEKKYKNHITRYKTLESATDLTSSKYETVRPEVNLAADRQVGPYLRPYLIPPVVAQVDAEQPLEYLTEMRQVTTVFINLVLEKKGTIIDIIDRVDEVYTLIWQVVHKQMGVVNKVCMFDKDIMFLVIFGLRGAHHEYNALKSLKCAYKIRSVVTQMRHVLCLSVGVTVGLVYCGVVGHPLRQEYTVIGAPVNKAARLMMYYPNRVTCDQATYNSSGLPSVYFVEQEKKVLKGIGKVGGIYEYTEGRRGLGNINVYSLPALLGQETEMETFYEMLNGADGFPCGILYSGDTGVGKSRLLQEFLIACSNRHFRTILITLHANHTSIPFYTIQQIFKQVYNIGSEEDIKTRQERVIGYLQMTEYERFACLLNPILGINITDRPPPEIMDIVSSSVTDLKMMRERVFRKLVELVCVEMIIFIDNIQYCDNKSADLLPIFLQEGNAAMVMTVSKKSFSTPRRWFKNVKLIIYQLENLEDYYIAPLACQLLGVRAIPFAIEELIINQPNISPGWCQRYLQSLLDSKAIQIEKVQRKDLENMKDMIVPDIKLLQKRIIGQEYRPIRITFVNEPPPGESMEDEVQICSIVQATEGIEQRIPETMEGIIMSAFDCLSPYEQLLLKCGSVIGNTFSREMLHSVLFKRSPKETAQAIKRLFEMHIISCAQSELLRHHETNSEDTRSLETSLTLTKDFEINCSCRQRTVHDDFEDAYAYPYYAFCNELQFTVPLFRTKTYDLLPTNQKILFHKRIAAFLEIKLHPPEYLKPGTPSYYPLVLRAMSSTITRQQKVIEQISTREKGPKFRELHVTRKTEFQPTLYKDIIRHLHKAGLKENELLTLIEYSEAALLSGCTRRGINALFNAEDRLREIITENKFKDFDYIQFKGKLHTLFAQAYADLKYLQVSKSELDKARNYLIGGNVKWTMFKLFRAAIFLRPGYVIHSFKTSHWMLGSKNGLIITRIEFFNVQCINYMAQKNWTEAKKSAIKGAILVMKCFSPNICIVCNTFTNLIDIYNHAGKFKQSESVKKIALNICSRITAQSENILHVIAYAKLQTAILICSFLQGKLEESLILADQVLKLGYQVSAWDATLFVQTILINVQMRLKKLDKVYISVEKLQSIGNNPLTTIHYHLICLILHLYTGVIIKSPIAIINMVSAHKLDYSRPLVIALGLFYRRRNEIQQHKYVAEHMIPNYDITIYNVHYEIMFFEYLLISIARKIDERDFEKSNVLFEEFVKAHDLGKCLSTVVISNAPHLMPRLLLLVAYLCQIKEFEQRSHFHIKKALHLSSKFGDKLEYEWIFHNKTVWANFRKAQIVADNRAYYDNWIEHSSERRHIFWNDSERHRSQNLLYALPLPYTSVTEYQEINVNAKVYQHNF